MPVAERRFANEIARFNKSIEYLAPNNNFTLSKVDDKHCIVTIPITDYENDGIKSQCANLGVRPDITIGIYNTKHYPFNPPFVWIISPVFRKKTSDCNFNLQISEKVADTHLVRTSFGEILEVVLKCLADGDFILREEQEDITVEKIKLNDNGYPVDYEHIAIYQG